MAAQSAVTAKILKIEPLKEAAERLGVLTHPPSLTVQPPTAVELARGNGANVDQFFDELMPRAKHLLLRALLEAPAAGGINLRCPLFTMAPGKIRAGEGDTQYYNEMFTASHAKIALERTEIYECGGSGFW